MRNDLEAAARSARGFMPHEEGIGLYETALNEGEIVTADNRSRPNY